jgi:hypothetical protein
MLFITDSVATVLHYTFTAPLHTLYFYGTGNDAWGFWAGRSQHDICAQLTHVDATHWMQQPEACAALCERSFTSFATTVATGAYFGALLYLGMWGLVRCTCSGWFARRACSCAYAFSRAPS